MRSFLAYFAAAFLALAAATHAEILAVIQNGSSAGGAVTEDLTIIIPGSFPALASSVEFSDSSYTDDEKWARNGGDLLGISTTTPFGSSSPPPPLASSR